MFDCMLMLMMLTAEVPMLAPHFVLIQSPVILAQLMNLQNLSGTA